MDDNSLMPFGKYRGTKLANVPAPYLLWWYNEKLKSRERLSGWNRDLWIYIEDNLDALKMEVQ